MTKTKTKQVDGGNPLAVVRETRRRILGGNWCQGTYDDKDGRHCVFGHWRVLGADAWAMEKDANPITDNRSVVLINDDYGYEAVIDLLDDMEDMYVGTGLYGK